MTARRSPPALALLGSAAILLTAQSPVSTVLLPPPPAERTVAVDQVAPAPSGDLGSLPVPIGLDTAETAAASQAPEQVTSAGDGARPLAQVGRQPRTAAASPALSARSEGQPGPVVRLGGRDRCDPGANKALSVACARVIERRADEFSRAPAAPTAEQRLLAAQTLTGGESLANVAERRGSFAARQAGNNPDDRTSTELASVLLGTQPQAPTTPEEGQPTAPPGNLGDLVETVTQGIGAIVGK